MSLTAYDFDRHTIQDPIHGAITFGHVEKALMDHRLFQRLHGLRQNSLLYLVFPAANHTRFDHSIGVMKMAGTFFDAVLKNQQRICEAGITRTTWQAPYRVDDAEMKETICILAGDPYYKLVLRAAALFHDIGHGPLSHLFDKFFPSVKTMVELMKESDYEHIRAGLASAASPKLNAPIRHETLSCVIATRILLDCSDEFARYGLDIRGIVKDVCAIIDDTIPAGKQFENFPYRVHGLFHDILSSDIDIDRMDYLLRDSHMCGVNYGLYDPDRILKSMCTYGRTDSRDLRIAVRYSGLGALEDLLLARYQMHAQIYGHKTNRACNAMLEGIRKRLFENDWRWHRGCSSITDLLDVFLNFDDHAFVSTLLEFKSDGTSLEIKEIAEKLFLERRLVKRVFEERADCSRDDDMKANTVRQRWSEHKKRLEDAGIRAAEDVFENKGPKVNSHDYPLKILRKHPQSGHYIVHEMKEFSTVIQFLPELECTFRIYCKAARVREAKSLIPS